jgi:hypothetical protein
MTQYEKFLTIDNFKLAFVRLKTAQRNLYKTIYLPDLAIFEVFLDENLRTLIITIQNKTYKPEKSHKIFIPKKNQLVRPLSMLKFNDLIVFQAMVNIIADECYDKIAPLYGNTIFGNQINTSSSKQTDSIFFYRPWKKNWKRFSDKSISFFNDGYKYLSEFDIASFFDTIDHYILVQILQNNYRIQSEITDLLSTCLEVWTADFNHKTFKSRHGIPQGPISSPFLADLYLIYLDEEITSKGKLDIKYARYVDDIRIFSKDIKISQKAIAALDLISRDLGLIPQGNKISIKEVQDIEKELKIQNNDFSNINKEFNEDNPGKESKKLKSKTHKRLKKRFLSCFETDDTKRTEEFLDKTIISFSLFKLNKDEEVKTLLIEKAELIQTHFEAILFYLRKHFAEDLVVLAFLNDILSNKDILFHHLIALIFKQFPDLQFNEQVFENYVSNKNRNWLVRYYMVDWLFCNNKTELFDLLVSENTDNYFIQRKINDYKFIKSEDRIFKRLFAKELFKSKDNLIALQGLYLSLRNLNVFYQIENNPDFNPYIKSIIGGKPDDFINYTLKNIYNIHACENFFNPTVWSDETTYKTLNEYIITYERFRLSQPSIAMLNINSFNNLCFDKICERLFISKPSKDYGVNLENKILESEFPKLTRYWFEMNAKRNQNTEAHPYDKYGNLSIKITSKELEELHEKQIFVLNEICNKRNY